MKRSLFVYAALLACSSCFADVVPVDPFADCKKLVKPRPKPTLVKKYLTTPVVASTPVKKRKVKKIPPLEDIEYIDCPPIKPPSLLTLIPPPDVVPVQPIEQVPVAPPATLPVAAVPCECATPEQPAYFVGYGGGGGGFYGGGGGGGWASGGQSGSPPPPLPPVPEPAQWLLILAGLGCMLYRPGVRWKIRRLT